MQFPSILAPQRTSHRVHQRRAAPALVFSAVLAFAALLSQQPAAAQNNTNDDVLVQMKQAFQRGDKARLTGLLPQARGHALEPWAAYWELKARLQEAAPNEVQDFFARYPGTYQEDRLRNDWLLLTGQRRDWDNFSAAVAGFRMGDDPQVRCYAVLADTLKASTTEGRVSQTLSRADKWLAQTPQMFRIGMLLDALERTGDVVTDEAGAIEAIGLSPLLVPGSAQNFKVTFPEDFALAEALLLARKKDMA